MPPLVDIVRAHARRNRTVLDGVTSARLAAMAIERTPDAQARSERALSDRMQKMLAVAERVPELRTDAEFIALQRALDAVESGIRTARDDYNEHVTRFDGLVGKFPALLIARIFGVDPAYYFEADGSTSSLGTALESYVTTA